MILVVHDILNPLLKHQTSKICTPEQNTHNISVISNGGLYQKQNAYIAEKFIMLVPFCKQTVNTGYRAMQLLQKI